MTGTHKHGILIMFRIKITVVIRRSYTNYSPWNIGCTYITLRDMMTQTVNIYGKC
jgi:hypothetical protein